MIFGYLASKGSLIRAALATGSAVPWTPYMTIVLPRDGGGVQVSLGVVRLETYL
jgi:hypothetical protein